MPIIGLGVDLVEAGRVERLVSRNEDIFRARILGDHERDEISVSANRQQRVLAYARSIAAKEAFLKALGTGLTPGMRWPDVQILSVADSKPTLAVCGEAARILAARGAADIQLSLSSVATRSSLGQILATVMLSRAEANEISL